MMRSLVTAHTYAVQFAVSSTAATASRVTVRRLRIAASSTGQRRRSGDDGGEHDGGAQDPPADQLERVEVGELLPVDR